MKNKIIHWIPFVLVLFVFGFSYFSQWCAGTGQVCYGTLIDQMIPEITYPAYFFALYVLPIVLILAFVARPIFNSWLKFTAWMLPLLFIFVVTTPVSSSVPLDVIPFYRDDAARVAGGLFATLSLILIIWKYFSLRKSAQKQEV